MTFSATPAALFRMVGARPITILFDEVDAIFDSKRRRQRRPPRNAQRRIQARPPPSPRCKGDAGNMVIERFRVFAPAALAGIAGECPTPSPPAPSPSTCAAAPRRNRRTVPRTADGADSPHRSATRWPRGWPVVGEQVGAATPDMPAGVTDRAAEIWEPLLAIADAAGGHWPETARAACRPLRHHRPAEPDLRPNPPARRPPRHLHRTRSHPHEHRGNPRRPPQHGGRTLGRLLRQTPQRPPARLRIGRLRRQGQPYQSGGKTIKGYVIDGETGLGDAWARYLPAEAPPAHRKGTDMADNQTRLSSTSC